MPLLSLTINDRPYSISCQAGEEERIRQLGVAIDQKVKQLAKQVDNPTVTDAHILVLYSLMATDEVWNLRQSLQQYQSQEQQLTDEVNELRLEIEEIAESLPKA